MYSKLIRGQSSVSIVSIVRLHVLLTVDYNDATYSVTGALIWSMLEPSIGIILACVPILKNLIPKIFSTLSGGSSRTKDSVPQRNAAFDVLDEHPLSPVNKHDDVYHYHREANLGEDGDSIASGRGVVQREGPLDKTREIRL